MGDESGSGLVEHLFEGDTGRKGDLARRIQLVERPGRWRPEGWRPHQILLTEGKNLAHGFSRLLVGFVLKLLGLDAFRSASVVLPP
jgi:hypothetical protein